ncbi:hypothetical protein DL771_008207 [Monosporascus sp. 5C6A]|nr:hypothetical protein DL771_008207 [Monosporascus sp. 5C6A]
MHFLPVLSFAAVALSQTFDWDCTNSRGPCENACYATFNGLHNGVLTYDGNAANSGPRRDAAGCSQALSPCTTTGYANWGSSCDEYPFASTLEGGAGATLRCVDPSENNSQGGSLSSFYQTIAAGTSFNIVVRGYDTSGYCANNGGANDGSEFTLVNGNFQNARKLRRHVEFADAQPRNPQMLRHFENENGETVALLNPNFNGTLVGTSVSDGLRSINIVKEIF